MNRFKNLFIKYQINKVMCKLLSVGDKVIITNHDHAHNLYYLVTKIYNNIITISKDDREFIDTFDGTYKVKRQKIKYSLNIGYYIELRTIKEIQKKEINNNFISLIKGL
jgi:hypothetical protein